MFNADLHAQHGECLQRSDELKTATRPAPASRGQRRHHLRPLVSFPLCYVPGSEVLTRGTTSFIV